MGQALGQPTADVGAAVPQGDPLAEAMAQAAPQTPGRLVTSNPDGAPQPGAQIIVAPQGEGGSDPLSDALSGILN